MPGTLWDIQQQIRAGAKGFGSDPGAPYTSKGKQNHLQQYYASTRNTTKLRHALDHCFQMALHAHAEKKWPLALDWIVAAFSLITSDGEDLRVFEETLFQVLWITPPPPEKKNWGQLKTKDPNLLDSRWIGATFALLINTANDKVAAPGQPLLAKLVEFVEYAIPDVCQALHVSS